MDLYRNEVWIPKNMNPIQNTLCIPPVEENHAETFVPPKQGQSPHPDIDRDPFLSDFFKYLPQSSLPMAGCDLQGIDLQDPNSMISVVLNLAKEV